MKTITLLSFLLIGISVSCQNAPIKELAIGDKAPELSFKTPEGKTLALSSFKGDLVLIDFWASWCGPCRRENPTVVKAYNEYKDAKFTEGKKFVIYSVSLDKNMEAWKGAIAADKLVWTSHVSDLGGWQSKPAEIYNVHSIPSNYLINGKGVIIAKDLRGEELIEKLKSLKK